MIHLALIAVVEAVVLQARYRSAVVGGPFAAAWWTFAACAGRDLGAGFEGEHTWKKRRPLISRQAH